ncbi:MAG: hypothetical protein NT013_09710 [Planctomycetia bacterium]|nr:hypothetical protein [Planctomycetia bacterium]
MSQLEHVFQVRTQFCEERDDAGRFADVMLSFRGMDGHSVGWPVDISPTQRQSFGRDTDATEPRQRDQQPPFSVGASVDDFGDGFLVDEATVFRVRLGASRDVLKRVGVDQLSSERVAEECSGETATASHRHCGQRFFLSLSRDWLRDVRLALALKMSAEVVGVPGGDAGQFTIGSKRLFQVADRVTVKHQRPRFRVSPANQVGIQKLAKRDGFHVLAMMDQPHGFELLGHHGKHCRQPFFSRKGNRSIETRRIDDFFHVTGDSDRLFERALAQPECFSFLVESGELDFA